MIPGLLLHTAFTGAADTQHEKKWRVATLLLALLASGS
jgi:hypothetical protein